MNTSPEVLKDTVKGVVLVLDYINNVDLPCNLGDIYMSFDGKIHPDANTWVFEFVKDGVTQSLLDYVKEKGPEENYELIWDMTNRYLSNFGFTPVAPEPVVFEDADGVHSTL